MLFHDAVQTPEWRDGRRPGAMPAEEEDVLLQVLQTRCQCRLLIVSRRKEARGGESSPGECHVVWRVPCLLASAMYTHGAPCLSCRRSLP